MDWVERVVLLIYHNCVINKNTLPIILLAEPYSKSFVFNHTIFILEKSSNKPLGFFAKDLYYF
jgi:hypothetical protein